MRCEIISPSGLRIESSELNQYMSSVSLALSTPGLSYRRVDIRWGASAGLSPDELQDFRDAIINFVTAANLLLPREGGVSAPKLKDLYDCFSQLNDKVFADITGKEAVRFHLSRMITDFGRSASAPPALPSHMRVSTVVADASERERVETFLRADPPRLSRSI